MREILDIHENKSFLEMQYEFKQKYDDELNAIRLSKFLNRELYSHYNKLRNNSIGIIAFEHIIRLQSEFEDLVRKIAFQKDKKLDKNISKLTQKYQPSKANEVLLRGLNKLDMDRLKMLSEFFEINPDENSDRFDCYKKLNSNRDKYIIKLRPVFELHHMRLNRYKFEPYEVVRHNIYTCVVLDCTKDEVILFEPAFAQKFTVPIYGLNQSNPERLIVKGYVKKNQGLLQKLNIFKICSR